MTEHEERLVTSIQHSGKFYDGIKVLIQQNLKHLHNRDGGFTYRFLNRTVWVGQECFFDSDRHEKFDVYNCWDSETAWIMAFVKEER